MAYTTVTDELLSQMVTALNIIAGYRITSAAITNNGGSGTAVVFATAFASDDAFVLLTEARDSGGVRVDVTLTNITKSGFTAIPPKDCTLKYLAMVKTS